MKYAKITTIYFLLLSFLFYLINNQVQVIRSSALSDLTGFTIVDSSNSGEYINDTINQFLNNGIKKIYIKNGDYKLNGTINITQSDITLIGETKDNTKLIQTQKNVDSIDVLNTTNVLVSDLTIDNSKNGYSCFAESNSNNITLKDCLIYGQDTDFSAVYFMGKSYPTANSVNPIDGIKNDDMDSNNKIINNTIYSKFNGNGVSFSVQKDGLIENNTVIGTRISIYICKDSKVLNNTINNSSTNGICVSIPSENNEITQNSINNSKMSGIKVIKELDYVLDANVYGNNINIHDNDITNTQYMGIEINRLSNSVIERNNINKTDNIGIYLLQSNNVNINNNFIADSGYATITGGIWGWNNNNNASIFIDSNVSESIIDNNTLINENFNCNYGIKETNDNINNINTISNNNIRSGFNYPLSLTNTSINSLNYIIDLKELDKATFSVTQAESSKLQLDVDSAKILVDSLPDGIDKNDLSHRLDSIIIKTIATSGAITIKYLDENNNEISNDKVMNDLKFKSYTLDPEVIDGYNLNDTSSKTVNLSVDNNSITVCFYYKKITMPTITTGGAVTINIKGKIVIKYTDNNGAKISENEIMDNLDLKDYTVKAKTINGYDLNDNLEKTVDLTADDNFVTITFKYKTSSVPNTPNTTDDTVIVTPPIITTGSAVTVVKAHHHHSKIIKGSITIQYLDSDKKQILKDTIMDDLSLDDYKLTYKVIEGYELNDISEKNITLTSNDKDIIMTFNYKKLAGCWKQLSDGSWVFYDLNGKMVISNWINLGGTWYYLNHKGIMVTGWQEIDGCFWYFQKSGEMKITC